MSIDAAVAVAATTTQAPQTPVVVVVALPQRHMAMQMAIRAAMAIRLMALAAALESVVKAAVGSYPGGGGGGSMSEATARNIATTLLAMAGQACLVAMGRHRWICVLSLATRVVSLALAKSGSGGLILEPNRIMLGGGGGAGGSAIGLQLWWQRS